MDSRDRILAEEIRTKCIEAAKDGFKEASMSGLCADGAMEAAISAMQSIDLDRLIKETEPSEDSHKKRS